MKSAIISTAIFAAFSFSAAEESSMRHTNTIFPGVNQNTTNTANSGFALDSSVLNPPNIAIALVSADYTVGIYDFTAFDGVSQSEERITPLDEVSEAGEMWAMAPVHFDGGDKLTSMTFFGVDTTLSGGMILELRKKSLQTNEIEVVSTVKTFEPEGPLIVDTEGNTLWDLYSGNYAHGFDHVYWPTEFQVYHHDRSISIEMDEQVDTSCTYYVYLYTVGTVAPEKVQFWSASFSAE